MTTCVRYVLRMLLASSVVYLHAVQTEEEKLVTKKRNPPHGRKNFEGACSFLSTLWNIFFYDAGNEQGFM